MNTTKTETKPLTMYVHPVTKITKDYGDELCREEGVTYSWNNASFRSETCGGVEMGVTVEDKIAKMAGAVEEGAIVLVRGNRITISHDMNPHGFI